MDYQSRWLKLSCWKRFEQRMKKSADVSFTPTVDQGKSLSTSLIFHQTAWVGFWNFSAFLLVAAMTRSG